ncbi:Oidioi.mRNA.OKI2018_I69.XSR.g16352.t2.cds [Oikopleura dioica]|uniref:Oidioi.mRNA.OKI2018_I69.XSR.g16352.t2.cds n=1 Tax=Oikopleura dioica TaxID=34765 RepID=A0ABN7SHP1_OIKDI|nr:Oidioi.mRNA.OKI2018_I69.XSR.g16352.t2.cds [Oikopleura dioica]
MNELTVGVTRSRVVAGGHNLRRKNAEKLKLSIQKKGQTALQRHNQNRLRRLIARQGDVLSRNTRYNPKHIKSLNWIYEDMRKKLLQESSRESSIYFQQLNEKLKKQEKQIRRISRDRRRGRQYLRQSSRARRDAEFSMGPSTEELLAVVRQQTEQIRELQSRNQQMQHRMAVIEEDLENSRADFGALKTDTRNMLLERTEGSGSSFVDYETVTFVDQSSNAPIVGNSTMEELIQELVFRIDSMEYRMNQTSAADKPENFTSEEAGGQLVHLISRLDGIEERVQEKNNRLSLLEVSLADSDSLGKLKKLENLRRTVGERYTRIRTELNSIWSRIEPMDRAAPGIGLDTTPVPSAQPSVMVDFDEQLQNIYDSINSTSTILTHLEEYQNDISQKLSDNEDNLLRLNSTVTDTVNSLVDFSGMIMGLQDALENFKTHYSQFKDESDLKFVNTSAHLKSVDATQALSIELFDRMDAVNEEFRERVMWLQDLLVLSQNFTAEIDYDTSSSELSDAFDDSIDDYDTV